MMVDPVNTALLWLWFTFWAALFYLLARSLIRIKFKQWNPRHQWKILAAVSVLVLLPATVYMQLFPPLHMNYSKETAAYWMGRAVGESTRAGKEIYVARVALAGEYGSVIAKQAIDNVASTNERCLLRTILADLPKVRDQTERRQEAQQECARAQKP